MTRYWVYQDAEITGPVDRGELALVAQGASSVLVCPEDASGAADGDWKTLEEIPELSDLMAVNVLAPAGHGLMPEEVFSEATRWLGLTSPEVSGYAGTAAGEVISPAGLFDSMLSGSSGLREMPEVSSRAADSILVADMSGRLSEMERRQNFLIGKIEQLLEKEVLAPSLVLPRAPAYSPPTAPIPPAHEDLPVPKKERDFAPIPLPVEPLPEAVLPAQAPPKPEEGAPPRSVHRWVVAAKTWPKADSSVAGPKKGIFKLAPPKQFPLASGLAESLPEASGFPEALSSPGVSASEPIEDQPSVFPGFDPVVQNLPAAGESEPPEPPTVFPSFEEAKKEELPPSLPVAISSVAVPFSPASQTEASLTPSKIELIPPPPITAPPVSAPAPEPKSEPIPTPDLGEASARGGELPPAHPVSSPENRKPPMTMRFSVTPPTAQTPAKPENTAAAEEVISRLARHSDETRSGSQPKPKRRQTRLFAVVIGGAFLALVVLFFLFFRNTKDINLLFNMGESQAPIAAGADDELAAAPSKPRATEPSGPGPGALQETGADPLAAPAPSPQAEIPPQSTQAKPVSDLSPEAIEAVKNHPLPGMGKSIGEWLRNSFAAEDGASDRGKWDAGAVEAMTYMVRYTVIPFSDGRTRDAVTYLFEIDLNRKAVKGNNPAARKLLQGRPAPKTRRKKPVSNEASRRAAVPRQAAQEASPLPEESGQSQLMPPSEEGASFDADTIR